MFCYIFLDTLWKKLIDCLDCPVCISTLYSNPEITQNFPNLLSLLNCMTA